MPCRSAVTKRSLSDLEVLVPSWIISLEAGNKSPATVMAYTYATTQFAAYLRAHRISTDVTAITREHVESFLADLLDQRSSATAETRYRGLRQFFSWAEEEGEITRSPMARMKPPKVAEQPVNVPPLEDIQRLLKACTGNGFEDRRDTAIIRVFADAGLRLGELAALQLEDVDLSAGMIGLTLERQAHCICRSNAQRRYYVAQ
jgi:site-specific recombinase XerD